MSGRFVFREAGLGVIGFLCGAVALFAVSASKAETAQGAAAIKTVAAVPRASDGLFYVQARVNGQSIRLLVDTGATHLTLTAEDARRIGVVPDPRHGVVQLRTAGGAIAMSWTRLDNVNVADREVRNVRAAVIQSGLSVSLLGQDMLARLGPIAIEGNRLRIG